MATISLLRILIVLITVHTVLLQFSGYSIVHASSSESSDFFELAATITDTPTEAPGHPLPIGPATPSASASVSLPLVPSSSSSSSGTATASTSSSPSSFSSQSYPSSSSSLSQSTQSSSSSPSSSAAPTSSTSTGSTPGLSAALDKDRYKSLIVVFVGILIGAMLMA